MKRIISLLGGLLSLLFLAAELKTWHDFVDAAKSIILNPEATADDMAIAKGYADKAEALKGLDALGGAGKDGATVTRPPFGSSEDTPPSATTANPAIKTWYVKRYGELPIAAEQIASELYPGRDYTELSWAKHADFNRYLRRGQFDPALAPLVLLTPTQILDAAANGLTVGEIKATMVEAQDSLGGYLAPEDVRMNIIERLPGLTVVRPIATVITTSRDRVTMPKGTGGNSRYTGNVRVTWVDETPTATEADTNATFGQVGIPIYTTMAHTSLSRNLLEDSAFNVVAYMERQYTTAMAIDEDEQFLVGSGVGKPQGILNGTAASGAPFDTDVTTVVSTNASALTAKGLKRVPYGLAGQYRQAGAVWVGAKATYQTISELTDGAGAFYWADRNQQLANARPVRLEGYEIRESEAMPAVAANTYPLIFGDFTGYTIADRIGLSIDRYDDSTTAKTNSVVYVARRRLGGMVTEGWRFVAHKVAAS